MTIRVPLSPKEIGGARCDSPVVTVRILTRYGDYVALPFLLDTGADCTSIPIALAQREGIAFDRSQPGTAAGLVGRTRRYRATIRVKIANHTHFWPCYFLETPADVGAAAISVLGRAGFLEDYDFCVDDQFLTLTKRTSFWRWWRRVTRFFSRPLIVIRSRSEPL